MKINKAEIFKIVLLFDFMIVLILYGIYTSKSSDIDKSLNEDSTNNAEPVKIVKDVFIVREEGSYSLKDLSSIENLETVVDVHVYYTDGTDDIKPAYIVYDDIDEAQYEDIGYGKIILPQK